MICRSCYANDDTLCVRTRCRFFVPIIPRRCSFLLLGADDPLAMCANQVRWMVLPGPSGICDDHVAFYHEQPAWREACGLKLARVVRLP